MTSIAINLEVNDKGSVVVDRFTDKTVSKVRQMSKKSMQHVQRLSAKFTSGLGGAVSGVGRSLLNLKTLAIGALAGWGLTNLAAGFIQTGSAMDQMRMSLDTITKGRGQEWFDKLNEWALTMPVNTEKAIQSFIMMQAMGLQPSIDQMTILVDTMSALGGGADTMQGIARALGQIQTKGKVSSEELMQLAERGVPVFEILKEKFGEVETSSLDAGKAIAAIFEGMAERFGGQSSRIQNKWAGLTETLKSYWTDFKRMVMDSGLMIYLETGLKKITDKIAALRSSGDLQQYARDVAQAAKEAGTTALNAIAGVIESIPGMTMGFAAMGSAVSRVTTGVVALAAAAVDAAGVIAAMRSPASIATAAAKGLRAATPGLARVRDTLDEMGVKAAGAGLKFDDMGSSAAGNADKAQQMADKIRGFSRELNIAADQQIKTSQEEKQALDSTAQAAQQSAQKMAAVWKDEIVKIDGVWTNLKKKVMVPVESTLQVQDKATPVLGKVEAQSKKTSQVMEKKATVSINDQATSTLKQIQAEMAKIKDKTVTVKVVHTGTGSTELPLTEKVSEILGMYEQMPSSMAMNMDMTQVTAGFDTLLDISNQLASAQRSVGFNRDLSRAAGLPYKTTSADYEANRLETLYNTLLSSMTAPAGSQVSGSATSVSVDQLNINVPNAQPQTTEDWRMIVREHVIPELERVGHA